MKKIGLLVFTLAMVLGMAVPNAYAAYDGEFDFSTGDNGYPESTIYIPPGHDVTFYMEWAYAINANSDHMTKVGDFSPIYVKLCNRSTGSCTSNKNFTPKGARTLTFWNMRGGYYDVIMSDSWGEPYYFWGYVSWIEY